MAAAKQKAPSKRSAPIEHALADMPARDRICYAAFGAFLEYGYEGTSTLKIATRAKVSKRELYAHFRNKHEIFSAGVAARARRMSQSLDLPQAKDRPSLAATLLAFGRSFLREVTQPEVTAVIRLVVADASRSSELAETFYKIGREPPRLALASFFEWAREANLVAGADSERMAGQYFSLLIGDLQMQLMLRVADPPSEAEIERRARAATAALMSLYPAE